MKSGTLLPNEKIIKLTIQGKMILEFIGTDSDPNLQRTLTSSSSSSVGGALCSPVTIL